MGCAIDLLPSFAAISKGKLSKNEIDGVDITSLWKGDFKSEPRKSILYYYGKNNLNAVRKGNWKLVFPHDWNSYNTKPGKDGVGGKRIKKTVEKLELYNMERDPGEQYNVIDYNQDKVKEIMLLAKQARKKYGDLNVGIKTGSGTREIGKLE
ncbi:hypothetical protein [Postechiella marina]|uniref:hypothetical protein n=1 Tax=Postechiella marina TaxID=943941 RepID=UPI0031DE2BE3